MYQIDLFEVCKVVGEHTELNFHIELASRTRRAEGPIFWTCSAQLRGPALGEQRMRESSGSGRETVIILATAAREWAEVEIRAKKLLVLHGLTLDVWLILDALCVQQMSQKRLAEVTKISKVNISRGVSNLVAQDFVLRERVFADGRLVNVSITALGIEAMNKASAAIVTVFGPIQVTRIVLNSSKSSGAEEAD